MLKEIIKIIIGSIIIYLIFKVLFMLLGFILWAALVITLTIALLVFMSCIGENGYPHKCKHANKCPGAVRCKDERKMDCYDED